MKTKTFVFILHFAHLIVPLQMMTEMHFENLTIGYQLGHKNEKVVARGLSATLKGGQLTCLLGRNGTGKSTLLRTLAERWRGAVAVVLTDPLDVRNLTAEEVVALGRTPYTNFWGTLRQDDKAAVAEAMQLEWHTESVYEEQLEPSSHGDDARNDAVEHSRHDKSRDEESH